MNQKYLTMKTIFLLVLLIVTINANSQTLDGFFGMKFGSPLDSIKKIMASKPDCKLETKYVDSDNLVYSGIKFAGRQVILMSFSFNGNNKLHTGKVILRSDLDSKVVDLYNAIKSELNEKYFVSTSDYELYEKPYEKGDGFTVSAIKLGKVDFSTYWRFKNSASNSKDNDNVISIKITDSLLIVITYQDGILIDEVVSKSKSKNFKDY